MVFIINRRVYIPPPLPLNWLSEKMSEIIKKRISESIGKEVKIFLHNEFRYVGKILNCDDKYIEILDYKIKAYKIIEISDIKDLEVER